MGSLLRENRFRKTARCPSSQTLLRYHRHHLPIADHVLTEIHLEICDFCSAELQLLTCYRTSVDEYCLVDAGTILEISGKSC